MSDLRFYHTPDIETENTGKMIGAAVVAAALIGIGAYAYTSGTFNPSFNSVVADDRLPVMSPTHIAAIPAPPQQTAAPLETVSMPPLITPAANPAAKTSAPVIVSRVRTNVTPSENSSPALSARAPEQPAAEQPLTPAPAILPDTPVEPDAPIESTPPASAEPPAE